MIYTNRGTVCEIKIARKHGQLPELLNVSSPLSPSECEVPCERSRRLHQGETECFRYAKSSEILYTYFQTHTVFQDDKTFYVIQTKLLKNRRSILSVCFFMCNKSTTRFFALLLAFLETKVPRIMRCVFYVHKSWIDVGTPRDSCQSWRFISKWTPHRVPNLFSSTCKQSPETEGSCAIAAQFD